MKQNIIPKIGVGIITILILHSVSCQLDKVVKAPNFIPTSVDNAPEAASIESAYKSIYFLTNPGNIYGINEYSGDIAVAPTRGTDWFDGGVWIQYALHTWTPSHVQNKETWNEISKALYQSTVVAETTTGQTQAEGKFIRAFVTYLCCDLFGQVQHRPATAAVSALPDVFTRSQAIDYLISELKEALPNLPSYNGANRGAATKEAAAFLLAKAYLNKAVYKQDPTNPEGPFIFPPDDMNKVIQYCDEIDANPLLAYSNYWDNFKWDNAVVSKENIFVCAASNGANPNTLNMFTLHYYMSPSGWNGVVILPAFYDSFEEMDIRKNYKIPNNSEYLGYNAGFIIGQVYAPQGPTAGGNKAGPGIPVVPINDRGGNPLIFTRDFSLFASSEEKGIRYNKFPISLDNANNNSGWKNENDFPVFRYADMRLMKAEAILRGGTSAESVAAIVNELRINRKASPLTAPIDLKTILAERGRELYLEGWRRPDLVRFGKYNDSYLPEQKTKVDGSRVILPIPDIALTSNPNLKQNFGY